MGDRDAKGMGRSVMGNVRWWFINARRLTKTKRVRSSAASDGYKRKVEGRLPKKKKNNWQVQVEAQVR